MSKKGSNSKSSLDETKGDKFVRVVEPRVEKAVKYIGLIGNCAGTGYTYTDDQASQITAVLHKAVEVLGDKFANRKGQITGFKFTGE